MKQKIKLTQFSSGAGWACKLAPEALSQVLGNLNKNSGSNTLIDYKEAIVFGFLGVLKLLNINNCYSSVTGSSKDHCSGEIFLP